MLENHYVTAMNNHNVITGLTKTTSNPGVGLGPFDHARQKADKLGKIIRKQLLTSLVNSKQATLFES